MALSHRNSIALSGITALNGIAKSGLTAINGQTLGAGSSGIAYRNAVSNNAHADPCSLNPAATSGDTGIAIAHSNSSGTTVGSYASGFIERAVQACTADAATTMVATKTTMSGAEGSIAPIDASGTVIAAYMGFSGVNQTTPLNPCGPGGTGVIIVNQDVAASPVVVSSGSFTPTVDGCMIVAIFCPDAASPNDTTTTFSTTSGAADAWTKVLEITGASSNRYQIAGGYAKQTTAGAITIQSSCAGDTSGGTLVVLVLNPA